jgi:hypothetical protein
MYRGTNFTESNESFRSIEGEMQIAARLWTHFQDRGCQTRNDRAEAAYEFACDLYQNKTGIRPRRVADLSPEQQAIWMMDGIVTDWYSEWAEHAFPRVQMGHSFASMMMATGVSVKELEHVEAPWPAFAIEIPDKLLPVQAKGVESCITRACVSTSFMPTFCQERWWTVSMHGPRIELHRAGTLVDMLTDKEREGDAPLLHLTPAMRPDPVDAPVGDYEAFWDGYNQSQEDRLALVVLRLIVGVCVMMTERANYQERSVDLKKKLGPYAERFQKSPESRIYVLGKPVKVDFRQAVRAFIEGRTRGPMTVQRLVAGHHKRQPHGPGGSLRKWIFIEPYWQGPSDAEIVVRPHVGD